METVESRTILRHTGGMPSFMSALYMDLDAGVGAFSSINAQQGYRPTSVSQYAVQLMAAEATKKPTPVAPTIENPQVIKNAADYVGTYTSANGQSIDISGQNALTATAEGKKIALQRSGGADSFIATDPELSRYTFLFGRTKNEKEKDKPSPVIELMHGKSWYTNAKYTGPKSLSVPPEYAAYSGTYLGVGSFEGSQAEIVVYKGELWMEGESALERIGENEFRLTEDAPNPERIEFLFLANGKARLMKISGADFFRFEGE